MFPVRIIALTALPALFVTAGVLAQKIVPAVPAAARPLPLTAVRLTGGPLKRAQDLTAEYLLKLEPDRMLSLYRQRAGLKPKADPYGGWDGDGRNLTGHIGGHYLSAVSLMYAATGDPRFKERADYIVAEMKVVQDAHGDGYLGAYQNGRETFRQIAGGDIRSAPFDLNGQWVPWYTLHKTYAGLRDAYRHAGNQTALDLLKKAAAWTESIVSKLDDGQMQRMLGTEFGGMPEVLADLYADTGEKRWMELSYRFEHRQILDPLKKGQDVLANVHGNTTIPKLIGSAARYAYVGNEEDGNAARFFWDRVVNHHTFATGGHGKDEHWREPDTLGRIVNGRTSESCNIYNMLKLTRALFALKPDVQHAEFHERALFNHVLGSIDPEDGTTCYMVPVGRSRGREYSQMLPSERGGGSFTCCVGTGMENHALHGLGIYYESGDRLWVNLYAPSRAEWAAAGVTIEAQTDFPEGDTATFAVGAKRPKAFTLALRRPAWAGDGFAVTVNGTAVENIPKPASYVEIARTWKSGDTIAVTLPKALHLQPTPDVPERAAIMWGPLVLAGDLGPQPTRATGPGAQGRPPEPPPAPLEAPVLVAAQRPLTDWLKPVAGKPGVFRSDGVGRDRDVEFVPFYRLHRRAYTAYFDILTAADYEKRLATIAAERERRQKLEAATVGYVQPGLTQAEQGANQQGEDTRQANQEGRAGRSAGGKGWFSYEVGVDPTHPMSLVVTFCRDSRRPRRFDILVDGQKLAEVAFEASSEPVFDDVEYKLPAELVRGKQKLTVRFQGTGAGEVGPVFGVRTIRVGAAR